MVTLTGHGGGCCGMRHIHGFRGTVQEDISSLNRLLDANNAAEASNNLEVILSDKQAREKPLLIAELKRLGFVLTTSFRGQHGTPVHVFHRAKKRLPLTPRSFRWDGMVASSGLSGDLPRWDGTAVPGAAGVLPPNITPYNVPAEDIGGNNTNVVPNGSIVRITRPRLRSTGMELTVTSSGYVDDGWGGHIYKYVMENGSSFARSSFTVVNQAAEVLPPVADIRVTGELILNLRPGARFINPVSGEEFIFLTINPTALMGRVKKAHTARFFNVNQRTTELRRVRGLSIIATSPAQTGAALQALRTHPDVAEDAAEPTVYRHPNAEAPEAEVPVTRVLREYFAMFRDDRIRGPFTSILEVREAYPRVARYQLRDIMSNGTIISSDPIVIQRG